MSRFNTERRDRVAELALASEKLAELQDKKEKFDSLKNEGKLTDIEYNDKMQELNADLWKYQDNVETALEALDAHVYDGHFTLNRRNEVRAFENATKLLGCYLGEKATSSVAGIVNTGIKADLDSQDVITLLQSTDLRNAVGDITSANATPEKKFTSPVVHYLEDPLSVNNVINIQTTDVMDVYEWREESVEGGFGVVAEGQALPQIDYDDAEVHRNLKEFGGFDRITDRVLRDANRRHFPVYRSLRMLQKFKLGFESQVWLGNGTGLNMHGLAADITTDNVIDKNSTPLTFNSGAWTRAHVNEFLTGIGRIWDNVKVKPNYIVMHPRDFTEIMGSGSDEVGWFFSYGVSGGQSAPPTGIAVPMLFGTPILISHSTVKGTFYIWYSGYSVAYVNGGGYKTFTGVTGNDLVTLKQVDGMYTYANAINRFPKSVYRFTKAQA